MNNTIKRYYHQARKAGYSTSHAISAARTLEQWDAAEAGGLVRVQADAEQESYFDVYGEPEGYVNIYGKCVTAEQEREEMVRTLERDGCWVVYSEWFDGKEWHVADSVGMCSGYADPTDWRQNAYVPDLMRAALEAINERQAERHWEAECVLAR